MAEDRPHDGGGHEGELRGSEYPKNYDVPSLRERRFLWTARLFAIVAIVSMLVNASLGSALFALTPLKEVRPFMVEFSRGSDVVAHVEPINKNIEGFSLLAESLVRKYVTQRETIPRTNRPNAMKLRDLWGRGSFVRKASSKPVWNRFAKEVSAIVSRIRKSGRSRRIDITNVITQTKLSTYRVEFTSKIYGKNGKVINKSENEAVLEITFQDREDLTRKEALGNPTGFTVLSYASYKKAG